MTRLKQATTTVSASVDRSGEAATQRGGCRDEHLGQTAAHATHCSNRGNRYIMTGAPCRQITTTNRMTCTELVLSKRAYRLWYCTVLFSTLYCTVLYTVLYCTLYCTVHCIVHCTVLYTVLYCTRHCGFLIPNEIKN